VIGIALFVVIFVVSCVQASESLDGPAGRCVLNVSTATSPAVLRKKRHEEIAVDRHNSAARLALGADATSYYARRRRERADVNSPRCTVHSTTRRPT